MTIRRGERSCDAADDLSAVSDDEGPIESLLRDWKAKGDLLQEEPPVHPAATDFGPQSLAQFIRAEIERAKTEGRMGKAKAKAKDTLYSTPNAASSARDDADISMSLDGAVDKSMKGTKLAYADNALRHLRGLRDPPANPLTASFPRSRRWPKPQSGASFSSAPPKRSVAPLNRQLPKAGTESASSSANRRSIDFEDYAESVRNRNRPENRRMTYRDPAHHHEEDLSDESPPRPRKTGESLSHLVPARASTPDSEAPIRSPRRRTPRTPSDMRAMFTASSQLSISDAEDDSMVDLLGVPQDIGDANAFPELFAPFLSDSSDDSFNDSDDAPAPDTDSRLYERAMREDLRVMHRELAQNTASRRPSSHSMNGPSAFDYAGCIPSATPQFVPTTSQQPTSAVVPKTAPTTPEKCSQPRPGRRHRAASTADQDSDTDDPLRKRKSSKPRKSGKPKPTKKLAMIFDSSQSGWSVGDPLPDVGRPGDDPPEPGPGSEVISLTGFNYDIWVNVADYLSSEDLRRLRLVNRDFAVDLAPILLRSVVTKFGKTMFHLGAWSSRGVVPPTRSMLARYGEEIHRFGISFDYDAMGLTYAKPKITSRQETAWYGSYRWPLEKYPRFPQLQELEDLVDDNRPLLRDAFADLQSASELALSLDSGHGWLEGPDISDLALYESKRKKGTKIFGQTCVEDIWHTYGRNEYFKWAQQNSINTSMKLMASKTDNWRIRQRIREFSRMVVRDYDSFCDETSQPDFDPQSHTGGQAIVAQAAQQPQQNQPQIIGLPALQLFPGLLQPPAANGILQPPIIQQAGAPQRSRWSRHNRQNSASSSKDRRQHHTTPIPLQYPLIFNCHNIAADVGGRQLINSKTSDPSHFPLIPGHLTEAQVQWLMETVWAQRAFLSAYTTAIITHKLALRKVHTLTIAKISSGLLPSLSQREFWTSLSGLKRLKILVKPDWRDEHIPGDKFYASNMPINPCLAAGKFADFLEQHVARLENLSHLTIGYFGGGEHAVGMLARNTHVLPTPITNSPRKWISDHEKKPDLFTLFAFPHIRDLTFENCWFSPCMLEAFMEKSRDTSLHTLVLDGVSMLSKHSTGIDGPLSTIRNSLRCTYDAENWLAETLPGSAVWTDVLDKITPGITMEERKYKTGMIDSELNPLPAREFRGNITKIVLKSCGYAKISGVKGDQFNQNALVVQMSGAQVPVAGGHHGQNAGWNIGQGSTCDGGLQVRKSRFDKVNLRFLDSDTTGGDAGDGGAGGHQVFGHTRRRSRLTLRRSSTSGQTGIGSGACAREGAVMMSTTAADGSEYFGLGTLTQCVHPVEKRVLETAWGMRFGWGNDMSRWGAVEDGWLEGGTGRFSGVVGVDDLDETSVE